MSVGRQKCITYGQKFVGWWSQLKKEAWKTKKRKKKKQEAEKKDRC
jgi:hypothetical protein